MTETLSSAGDSTSFHQTRALQRAILAGNLRQTSLFLKLGCNPNQKCGVKKATPLIMCCYQSDLKKREEIVKLLIEYGGNPSSADVDGNNVLHYACMFGLSDIAIAVCDVMDSLLYNAPNTSGNTPIHICAEKGESLILEILVVKAVKHGQTLSIKNYNGLTPLALACVMQNRDCAMILHANGATPRYSKIDLQLPMCKSFQVVEDSIRICNKSTPPEITQLLSQDDMKSDSVKKSSESCSNDIIRSLMSSRMYSATEGVTATTMQEPINQEWVSSIHSYKPSTFANIANCFVRSRSRNQKTPVERSTKQSSKN